MKSQNQFSDCDLQSDNFQFGSSQDVQLLSVGVFTEEYKQIDAQTSTSKQTRTIKFQVEANNIYEQMKSSDCKLNAQQEKQLKMFLNRIAPTVIDALNENKSLKLIHNYEPQVQSNRKEIVELYTLCDMKQKVLAIERHQEITDIQWNLNGLIIAAGYGQLEHRGSCDHKGCISAWNIGRRDFNTEIPQIQIETQGCVMCLSFHHEKPNVLAVGFFTGKITVFDISLADNELCSSEVDEYFHRESVTQLLWVEATLTGQMNNNLISLGSDGKILNWQINWDSTSQSIKYPQKGFLMLRKKESSVESVGATCMAKVQDESNNYLIGSEGGSVLRGLVSLVGKDKKSHALLESNDKGIIWKDEAIQFMGNINQKFIPEIKGLVEDYCKRRGIHDIHIKQILSAKPEIRKLYINPISFAYEAHYGTVFGISCSLHIRNIFSTCAMDGQIRIYDALNARSIITFEYLNQYIVSLQFSPSRPCVIGACSTTGEILIFDLKVDRKREIKKLRPEGTNNRSATNLRFNPRQQDLMACSYVGQEIYILQLSDQLVRKQEGEEEYLNHLLEELKVQ